jgi:uracil-DNA glycosylase family 4
MQKAHSTAILTEEKPQEIKTITWANQTTADLLANTQDLRFPFKESALACPFCGGTIDGEPVEEPEIQIKNGQPKHKQKTRPWELKVQNVHHRHPNPKCPCERLRKLPQGTAIEKLTVCHMISQHAVAESKTEEIHSDPSIPKLQSNWDETERELLGEMLGSQTQNPSLMGQMDKAEATQNLPEGQVQRQFPCLPKETKDTKYEENWEEELARMPRWEQTHPLDPQAPEISGWMVAGNGDNQKVLCGYILPGLSCQDLPETYHVPIYEVHGPESLLKGQADEPCPYVEVTIACCPPDEPALWREAATVRKLRKQEKMRRKKRIEEEISRLPQEKIWQGFSQVLKEDATAGGCPKGEPPLLLEGYHPGGDIKAWWLPGIGNPHAKVWVIGLYPSREEIKRKGGPKILSGASGRELFALIEACGLDPAKDVFFENMVKRYMPPKSKIGAEIKMEQTWLLRKQLATFKPERIICLGAEVFKEIVGDKSFQNLRSTWVPTTYPRNPKGDHWQGRAAGTFHPAGVLRPENRHNLELFRHDFKELILDLQKDDVMPAIKEIRTIEGAKAWLKEELAMLNTRKMDCLYAIDTESLSLEIEHDTLMSIQIARILGSYDKETQWLEAEEVPEQTDIFLLAENLEPEELDRDIFALAAENQLSLFGTDTQENPQPEEKILPPVSTVANSQEEREAIIEKHRRKKPRSLRIFRPDKRVEHLGAHLVELGEILNTLAMHKRVVGFAMTNANHDRKRLETFLDWNPRIPALHGGLRYPLDTMLAEHVLNENGDLGLKAGLNKHFNWPRQDALLDAYCEEYHIGTIADQVANPAHRSRWALLPWRILKPYAGKDAYGCARLLAKQMSDITGQVITHQKERIKTGNPNNLERAFHISCRAINGTYQMNQTGMPVGKKGMKILKELTAFYAGHEEDMIREYKESVFKLTGLRDANPASPDELAYLLFNESSPLRKRGVEPWKESGRGGRLWSEIPKEEREGCTPSTDAESLEIIASNCPDPETQRFLLRLAETKTILTIRSSFLTDPMDDHGNPNKKGLIGRINPRTLAMHTVYTPTLDTNRCRSVPNLTTLPKGEQDAVEKILGKGNRPPYAIRSIIQAPEGTWLLNRDWTTAEVLGLGYLSQDQNMLAIIARMAKGMDFHCKLAIQTYSRIGEAFKRISEQPKPDNDWISHHFVEKQAKAIRELWENAWDNQGWQAMQEKYEINPEIAAQCRADGKPRFPEEAIHTITKKVFKQERSNIKPVTFGVPYGREAAAIMKALNREYYVDQVRDSNGDILKISEQEAAAMIESYKTSFPQAWEYLVQQATLAKTNGFLLDHWGYIRHFSAGMNTGDLTRKAYNYQVQHIVAALMNQAMDDWVQIQEARNLKSRIYATNYDNLGWIVHEDELQEVWDISMEVMTEKRPAGPPAGDLPALENWHIPTEGELSQEWEGKKTKPEELGIKPHPEKNRTGLEGLF